MCKYCNKLKELRDLDAKTYKKIISRWRVRDLKARQLVEKLYSQLLYDGSSVLFISDEVEDFLNTNWV